MVSLPQNIDIDIEMDINISVYIDIHVSVDVYIDMDIDIDINIDIALAVNINVVIDIDINVVLISLRHPTRKIRNRKEDQPRSWCPADRGLHMLFFCLHLHSDTMRLTFDPNHGAASGRVLFSA